MIQKIPHIIGNLFALLCSCFLIYFGNYLRKQKGETKIIAWGVFLIGIITFVVDIFFLSWFIFSTIPESAQIFWEWAGFFSGIILIGFGIYLIEKIKLKKIGFFLILLGIITSIGEIFFLGGH